MLAVCGPAEISVSLLFALQLGDKVPGRRTPMNVLVKSSRQNKEHPRRIFGTLRACLMVAVLVLLTILIAASQSLSASFPVWVSPSLFRVGQTDAPGTVSGITLSSARGETVEEVKAPIESEPDPHSTGRVGVECVDEQRGGRNGADHRDAVCDGR